MKPIILVTHETDHFASYGGDPNEQLLKIKNRDEIGTLAHSLYQMECDIKRNIEEIAKMTAKQERISAELSVAARIQSDMLPKDYPPFPDRKDFDLFASMNPAKEVGGDLYDYLLLDSDHLMITVGDVSGKGIPAALFMGKTKVLLDFFALMGNSPKMILERTNEQLCKGNESGLFVTCWLGILTFSTGELCFANAGHPYPVVYQNGEFKFLKERPNLILGAMQDVPYEEHSIKFSKGNRIFAYTDGVTEATNSDNKLFGDMRLLEALCGTENFSAPETLKKIKNSVDAFAEGSEQFDDITMLQFILSEA